MGVGVDVDEAEYVGDELVGVYEISCVCHATDGVVDALGRDAQGDELLAQLVSCHDLRTHSHVCERSVLDTFHGNGVEHVYREHD